MSTVICPRCATESPAGAKFCAECGTRLTAPSSPPPEEERRLVTMLFADLAGSTTLGESLDPDALYALTQRVHHQLERIVHRYEGYVARHLGDGLLVLFGAPVAHENDAERAVLGALAMQEDIDRLNAEGRNPPLGMRIGITTGEVVAGRIAGIYDVIGDAPNVAARLQGIADIGTILVGEEAMRLARRRIRFGERQPLTLKGKRDPVGAYAALGVRERLGERWEGGEAGGGFPTPLIGREQKLAVIATSWARAQTGDGRILTIVGEPGIGKSRLVAEAVDRITMDGDVRLLRGRCLSYGQSVSLWLIADLLRAVCLVPEDAGVDILRERVAAAVDAILADSDVTDRAIARDVLGEVLGLPAGDSLVANAGPQVRRSALVRILNLMVRTLAEREQVLVVLEDLHWLDTASQELLETILRDVGGHRILVLATQRPGWTAPWLEWTGSDQVLLQALDEEDASALARAVLGDLPLSSELEGLLRERAEGNPFFVEELLHYLQETGALEADEGEVRLRATGADKLPATLAEVLLARLDRLASQVKAVAQVGSVIGRSFAVRLLARVMEREEAILDDPLRALQEAEITYPDVEGELQHVFRHALLRDAAYSMLVRRRQRRLHLAVGRAIAQLYPTDEYVEMIAYHLSRTDEDREAAEWLEKAGDRARDTFAGQAALVHYQAALGRLERTGSGALERARLETKVGATLNQAARFAEGEAILETAIARYEAAGKREQAGQAVADLGHALNQQGRPEEALQRVQETAALLAAQGPSPEAAQLELLLADVFQNTGRHAEMLAAAERMLEIATGLKDPVRIARAHDRRGQAYLGLGRPQEAGAALEKAIHEHEAVGNVRGLVSALPGLAEVRRGSGNLAGAFALTERGLDVALRTGAVHVQAISFLNLAQLSLLMGRWNEAQTHIEQAEERARTIMRAPIVDVIVLHARGHLALRRGDWDLAQQLLESAADRAAGVFYQVVGLAQADLAELDIRSGRAQSAIARLLPLTEELWEVGVLALLGWARLEFGDTRAGLELAEQAEREMRKRPALCDLPETLRLKGMALARLGRTEEAVAALGEGRERAAGMPNPYAEARILVELGLLERQEEQTGHARQHLEEALAIFRRLGARKDIERSEHELVKLRRSEER